MVEKEGATFTLVNIKSILNEDALLGIYLRLYRTITLKEAILERKFTEPGVKGMAYKDLIDDISSQGASFREGGIIKLWRELLNDYLEIRVGTRITQVTETTIKLVTKIIQQGIDEGLGALETARRLRDTKRFNLNRALAIARTETVTSMNQGKYMYALSSPFAMEKAWDPAEDERTRETHAEMADKPFIDLEAVFVLNKPKGGTETARYPGDESLSAANTVNCRCSVFYRVKQNPDGSLVRKEVV